VRYRAAAGPLRGASHYNPIVAERSRRIAVFSAATQFVRFLLVGGLATATQYAVLVLLVELAKGDAVTSSAIGYVCGSVLSYWINRLWTFGSTVSHFAAGSRFVAMVSLGFCCNAVVMFLMTRTALFQYLLSQAVATGITLALNFSLARFWVFRR
jgi:putative flippase GtrA